MVEWIKLALEKSYVIAIASFIILWNPSNFIDRLGYGQLFDENKAFILVVFLLTSALSITDMAKDIYEKIKENQLRKKRVNSYYQKLHKLTYKEKYILNNTFAKKA